MATLVTLKNETTLRQISERLYGQLDAKERARAEAALLKANPQLAEKEAFRPGGVVAIPPVQGLKPRPAAAAGQDPLGRARETIDANVAEYHKQLAANLDAVAADIEAQLELMKDKEVGAVLKRAGATDLAKQLNDALRTRAKALADDRKRQETLFKRIAADLDGFDPS